MAKYCANFTLNVKTEICNLKEQCKIINFAFNDTANDNPLLKLFS